MSSVQAARISRLANNWIVSTPARTANSIGPSGTRVTKWPASELANANANSPPHQTAALLKRRAV